MKLSLRAAFPPMLFALLFCAPAMAARTASLSFADINGIMSYGSGMMYSSDFESEGNAQELAVSTGDAESYSGRSGKLSFWPMPAPVNNLAAVAFSSNTLRLVWTAPTADWTHNRGAALSYILRYSTAIPITSDAGFRSASDFSQDWPPLGPGSGEERIIENFNPGTTYYFSIESVNDQGFSSEISNSVIASALPPLPPINLNVISSGTSSYRVTWMAPTGYQNRIPFGSRFAPASPYEVNSYQVFRATASANADWRFIAEVSSGVFAWTDVVDQGSQYYYHVKAINKAGASQPSYARAGQSGALYFLAPDNESVLEVPGDAAGQFFSAGADPLDTYSIEISTHPEEISGIVVKSVEFAAYKGGLQRDDTFKLSKPSVLRLYYQKNGAEIVPSAADSARSPRQAKVTALTAAKALSLYFYNGAKWLQLYGKVDETGKNIQLNTTLLGRYQIRSTERPGGFSADLSGLSNRLITPNGDGKNDTMVFIFDNPDDTAVKGRIFDIKGLFVATMKKGLVANSLVWDAKAGGQAVPGGVYIYQIEASGHVYNGTVVVVK
ncbi:MAG: gliding motility-associated C-terminal domain-containing protein [Elusimicrobia bacterium]|nr:gliding motility-associated C-terminal domain-containing protein [Elusimicrobiota bacterium]